MKKSVSFLLLLAITLTAFGQNYYYYEGKKQPLELDLDKILLLTDDPKTLENNITYNISSEILIHDKNNVLKNRLDKKEDIYKIEIDLGKINSFTSYNKILEEIRKDKKILNILPIFKEKVTNKKINLTESFYIKIKNIEDTILLRKDVLDKNLVILEQNEYMPLWFTIACTPLTLGNSLDIANKLFESGKYEAAEPDFRMDNTYTSDPMYYLQWGLENWYYPGIDINVNDAWQFSKGEGIKIAVLDHGIQLNHPDLAANIHSVSFDAENNRTGSVIRGEHGTACAGIIGAIENNIGVVGVSPKSTLISISHDLRGNKQAYAYGLNWAWRNGADIVSCSWGGLALRSDLIRDAIRSGLVNGRSGKGTIFVFASGNESSSAVSFPAEISEVIAVGAIDISGMRAEFSNYGSELNIVAPGVQIPTTDLEGSAGYSSGAYYEYFNGTSAACPHISGVIALILSVDPELTHQGVKNILESTARKLPNYSFNLNGTNGTRNVQVGYGLVDAGAAVRRAIENGNYYTIHGDKFVCATSYYKINHLPPGAIVSWSMENNPNNAPYPTLIQNDPVTNECSINNTYKYPLSFKLKATITFPDGTIRYANKDIVSEQSTGRPTGTFSQGCGANINNATIPNSAIFIRPNCEAIFNFSNNAGKDITISPNSGTVQPTYWYHNKTTNQLFVMLPKQGGAGFVFRIGNVGSCSGYDLTLFASETAISPSSAVNEKGAVKIYDMFTGKIVYQRKEVLFDTFNIKQSNLKEGYYVIEYETDQERRSEKVFLKY